MLILQVWPKLYKDVNVNSYNIDYLSFGRDSRKTAIATSNGDTKPH